MKTPRAHLWDEIAEIAKANGVPLSALRGRTLNRRIAAVRHEVWYVLRTRHSMSYPKIGAIFDRDHTSVIYGVGQYLLRSGVDDPELNHLRANVLRRRAHALKCAQKRQAAT